MANVKKHEYAQEWIEWVKVAGLKSQWTAKYSGYGEWIVTMTMPMGEKVYYFVFSFSEQTEEVKFIRESST